MAKGPNTARIGAFVIAGIALVVAAIAIFGSGRLFRESRQFVMNFTASMQGLNRGAPVMFSGVPVGEVTSVQIRLNEDTLTTDSAVVVTIFPDRFEGGAISGRRPEVLDKLIDRGLRARLVAVSLVTGQLGIEMGFYPGTPVRLSGSKPEYQEIPTIPSTVERFETTLQKILAVLESSDIAGLSGDIERTLESISRIATSPELHQAITDAAGAVKDMRGLTIELRAEAPPLLANLRGVSRGAEGLVNDARSVVPRLSADLQRLGPALAKLDSFIATAETTLKNANTVIGDVGSMTAADSQTREQLSSTLRDLSRTSAAVRSLVTALEDNPNSILFGAVQGGEP